MALINCPECGKEISDKAPACIHCGFPLQDSLSVSKTSNNVDLKKAVDDVKTWAIGYKFKSDALSFNSLIHILGEEQIKNLKSNYVADGYDIDELQKCKEPVDYFEVSKFYVDKCNVMFNTGTQEEYNQFIKETIYDVVNIDSKHGNEMFVFENIHLDYLYQSTISVILDAKSISINRDNYFSVWNVGELNMLFHYADEGNIKFFISKIGKLYNPRESDSFDILKAYEIWKEHRLKDKKPVNEDFAPARNKPSGVVLPVYVVDINVPKCPTCQSTNIKKISGLSKAGSVAMWGIFSRKVHKQWHCNNCGSEW